MSHPEQFTFYLCVYVYNLLKRIASSSFTMLPPAKNNCSQTQHVLYAPSKIPFYSRNNNNGKWSPFKFPFDFSSHIIRRVQLRTNSASLLSLLCSSRAKREGRGEEIESRVISFGIETSATHTHLLGTQGGRSPSEIVEKSFFQSLHGNRFTSSALLKT